MKVMHYNKLGEGGSAIASNNLHLGLRERGIESHLCSGTPAHGLPDTSCSTPSGKIARLVSKWRESQHRRDTTSTSSFRRPVSDFGPSVPSDGDFDILHLHWISEWLDITQLETGTPVVWSVHDLFPVTGGCHMNFGCQNYLGDCGCCPQLARPSPRDASRRFFQLKSSLYQRIPLHLVANSSWILSRLEESPLGKLALTRSLIPIGVDLERFRPRDRAEARRILAIPEDEIVLLFGAADLNDYNKNFALLNEAVAELPDTEKWRFLFFGGGWPESTKMALPARTVGFVSDPSLLSIVYAACDVFVMPSRFESFGLAALQASACARPVVASDAGGLTDIVRDGLNGVVFPSGNASELAKALLSVLHSGEKAANMGKAGRAIAEEEFDFQTTVSRYEALYRQVLAQSNG